MHKDKMLSKQHIMNRVLFLVDHDAANKTSYEVILENHYEL